MVNFFTLSVFVLAWGVISVIGLVSNTTAVADDPFVDLTDTFASTDVVTVDSSSGGIIGTITGAVGKLFSVPAAGIEWIQHIAKAATFQAPIWDGGWSNMIRVVLATLGLTYLAILGVKGLELLASFIPG